MKHHHHHSFSSKFFIINISLTIILFPFLVSSSKDCSNYDAKEQDQNKGEALKYKLAAMGTILFASALGVSLPFLGRNVSFLNPDKEIFFLFKAFAAGVILATGFVHILPDAFESLTSPCLQNHPWMKFPFTGFVAMLSAIGTLMMEAFATGYHNRSELRKAQPVTGDDEQESTHHHNDHEWHRGNHIHVSTFALERTDASGLIRHRIVSQVLEMGIVVHSVIIGLTVGASKNPKTIRPLMAALSFHQFFEGMGLGGCISQAKYKFGAIAVMVMFFSLTTPIGIAVGTGISNTYEENSPTALIVQGLLNSASTGILIYMSLVDLLAADFMNSKMLINFRLQLGASLTLMLGACSMSLLAKWA